MGFVGDSLRAHAERRPDDPALICGARHWSWLQLNEEAEGLARKLVDRVPQGGRVGLCLGDPANLLIAFFAVVRRGAIALVFDPDWPEARRHWIERETAPDFVLDDATLAALSAEPSDGGPPLPTPDADDLFYAGFTSGSTGDPKGYCRTHASWLASFDLSAAEFAIGEADRVVIPGSLVHSLHLYGAVHGLQAGATVELCPRFHPKTLAERLKAAVRTVFYATPTQIHYVAGELRRTGPAGTVRLVLASGAKWRAQDRCAMAALFPAARLVEFYGASEMSFITVSSPEDAAPDGSVGRAAHGVAIRIGDPVQPFAPGEAGPIWVQSRLLFDSYICGGGDEVRRQAGWLTVGDHGYLDGNGFLFLAGRQKRMIVSSGLNIYPEEVERVLLDYAGVRSAAVFGLPDPVRGSKLVAVVEGEPGAMIDEAGLRRWCLGALGRARTPRLVLTVDDWPLTVGGKTDLVALERRLRGETRSEAAQ